MLPLLALRLLCGLTVADAIVISRPPAAAGPDLAGKEGDAMTVNSSVASRHEGGRQQEHEAAEKTGAALNQSQASHEPALDLLWQEMKDLSTDVVRPPSLVAKAAAWANAIPGKSTIDPSSRFIFASHHKTGTILARHLARSFSNVFDLTVALEWRGNLERYEPSQLEDCSHIPQVVHLSNLDVSQLMPVLRNCDFRAIHFVRDPVNVVISGYVYHLWSDDTWHMDTGPSILGGLSKKEGLRKEAAAENAGTLAEMKDVEAHVGDDARFLDIWLEGLEGSYDRTMRAIGLHLVDNSSGVEAFVADARRFDTSRWSKRRRESDDHVASAKEKEELHAIFDDLVEAGDPDAVRVSKLQRDWQNRLGDGPTP